MSTYMMPGWHGCLDHNRNHCGDCQTCDCHNPAYRSGWDSVVEACNYRLTWPDVPPDEW